MTVSLAKEKNAKNEVSLKSKLCYGLAEAGSQFSWTFIGSYLTIFYTDVVGLSPAIIGIIMTGARILDALFDPMFGIVADRTNSKWGRFRPYLLYGTPLLALFNVLTFTNMDISHNAKAIWCFMTYVICGMLYSVVSISVASLGSVMSSKSDERVILMSFRGVMATISNILIGGLSMPLIMYFGNGGSNSSRGYFFTALIFSIILIPCLWMAFAGTKERITLSGNKIKVKLKDTLKIVFSDHNIICLLVGMALSLIATFGRLGIMLYYYIYVLNKQDLIAPLSMILGLTMVIPSFICPPLLKKFNKKNVLVFGNILSIIACIILYIGGNGLKQCAFIGTFLLGASSWATVANFGLTADCVDDCEVRTGTRNDGIIFSAISFSTKVGNAVGGGIGVVLLGVVGYIANAQQTPQVISSMNAVINLGPAVMFALAIIPFMMIKMTNNKAEENSKILAEKRKAITMANENN